MSRKVWVFFAIIAFLELWRRFLSSLVIWFLYWVGIPIEVLPLIWRILNVIVPLEICLRAIILQISLTPLDVIPTDMGAWEHVEKERLHEYEESQVALGFAKLLDYSIPNSTKSAARLFFHPSYQCFAEVGQVDGLPIFCSLSSCLENDYVVGVTDKKPNRILDAMSCALFKLPTSIVKLANGSSVDKMLKIFLELREKSITRFNAKPVSLSNSDDYFMALKRERVRQRSVIARQSMTLKTIKVIAYLVFPTLMVGHRK